MKFDRIVYLIAGILFSVLSGCLFVLAVVRQNHCLFFFSVPLAWIGSFLFLNNFKALEENVDPFFDTEGWRAFAMIFVILGHLAVILIAVCLVILSACALVVTNITLAKLEAFHMDMLAVSCLVPYLVSTIYKCTEKGLNKLFKDQWFLAVRLTIATVVISFLTIIKDCHSSWLCIVLVTLSLLQVGLLAVLPILEFPESDIGVVFLVIRDNLITLAKMAAAWSIWLLLVTGVSLVISTLMGTNQGAPVIITFVVAIVFCHLMKRYLFLTLASPEEKSVKEPELNDSVVSQ